MTNPACGEVIRNGLPGIPAAAGSPSLGSVTCACTRQSLAGRSFRRAVTTGAARSDGAHRWRSGWPLRGCRSLPIGSAAGAGVDTFSCLAAAGSRETCRLRCPTCGLGDASRASSGLTQPTEVRCADSTAGHRASAPIQALDWMSFIELCFGSSRPEAFFRKQSTVEAANRHSASITSRQMLAEPEHL